MYINYNIRKFPITDPASRYTSASTEVIIYPDKYVDSYIMFADMW
jgi:hypothetical protein